MGGNMFYVQIGRIVRAAEYRALTDLEVKTLRSFLLGWVITKKCAAKRVALLPCIPKQPLAYDTEELADFAVGNQDPEKRGLHLGVIRR